MERNKPDQTPLPGDCESPKTPAPWVPAPWSADSAAELGGLLGDPGFYDRLAQSADRSEFQNTVHAAVKHLGFTDYGFVRMDAVDDRGAWLFSLPEDLLASYHNNVYQDREYAWEYLVKQKQPLHCADLYEWVATAKFSIRPIEASLAVYELIKQFGYQDAYCLPLPSCDGEQWVVFMVLAQGMPAAWFKKKVKDCQPALVLLGQAIDYVGQTHFPHFFVGGKETQQIAMTEESVEVLETVVNCYLATGVGTRAIREAATMLGIRTKTVMRHVAAIKREFGANTLLEAISLMRSQDNSDK